MSVIDWLSENRDAIDELGMRKASREAVLSAWEGVLRRTAPVYGVEGTNVYERDWDMLLILDACRPDALKEVAPEYDFLTDIDTHVSPGSSSGEWLRRTFTDDYDAEIQRTAYVTSNPHTDMLDGERFMELDEVWRYAWPGYGSVQPESVADRIIDVWNTQNPTRLIGHFMQPHLPFLMQMHPDKSGLDYDESFRRDSSRNIYHRLRIGEVDSEVVWSAYLETLRWVLDHVELVLENTDAETVAISADHSELFGEFGCYCHPTGIPLPALRTVPWAVTTATNTGDYEPSLTPDEEARDAEIDDSDLQEQLNDLGYME